MDSLLFRGLPQDLTLAGLKPLRKAEIFAAQQKWRAHYASALHEETGCWTYRGYDWHTFSYGYTPCLDGDSAIAAMLHRLGDPMMIIPDAGNRETVGGSGIVLTCGDVLVGRNDWILVAQDFSWTFALTHEAGFGPYFAESCEVPGPR